MTGRDSDPKLPLENPKLPLENNGTAPSSAENPPKNGGGRRLFLIPLAFLVLFTGAVIGMYFQPPGLRVFFGLTGLEPGGGTDTPIATAVERTITEADLKALEDGAVVALGRLVPEGEVVTVAVPFGAEGTRIETLPVRVGQWIETGGILATLDNHADLQATVNSREADLAVSEAELARTRLSLSVSRDEAEAALKKAEAEADVARRELERARSLSDRGVASRAVFDRAEATDRQAQQEVERLTATVARYRDGADLALADILLAERRRDAALIALENARADLEKSILRAPSDGTVLDLHVRPGERPDADGVLNFGNTRRMTAEIEVYQNQIKRIQMGDTVRLRSEAFAEMLEGEVVEIGLEVGRQTTIDRDPAANTDARVITVTVALDEPSTTIAGKFINLEVLAWFYSGDTG